MSSRFYLSLRFKMIAAFFAIGVILSIAIAYEAYRTLEDKLFTELKSKAGSIVNIGAETIDQEILKALIDRIDPDLSQQEVDSIENSDNYKIISDRLNYIRDIQAELIQYVYLILPTQDENLGRYIVDADVLELKAAGDPDEEISHFGADMDLEPFPVIRQVFRDKIPMVEDEYTYDEAFDVNSVSSYSPIITQDGELLAILGLDMADTNVRSALADVTNKSIIIAVIALLISFLTAILLGTYLTGGILKLDKVVRSFANRDFSVRSKINSNDEVGRLGSSFNHMAETIENYSAQLEELLKAYDRFVPHDFLELLEKKSITEVKLGDQTQKEMTVLFSDIRNFTALSEKMTPRENFNFLNSFLERIGPEIRSCSGIIDKYIGDAVMALFPNDPKDAVNAAIKMQKNLIDYNIDRQKANYPAIEIGIGIHVGRVMLGTIGEHQRMDGTVISDTVNLASRLESLTKRYKSNLIISSTMAGRLSPQDYFMRLIDKVSVAGKTEVIGLYEVCDADNLNVRELKEHTHPDYLAAQKAFYARQFTTAIDLFKKILSVNPADKPVALYLERAEKLAQNVPAAWTGAVRYESKS